MKKRQPLSAGTVLNGRYRLRHLIGEGGFSLVYGAESQGHDWVVKELFDADRCDRNSSTGVLMPKPGQAPIHLHQLKRAREEWLKFRNLRHPNVVELVDAFEQNNSFYLVMPFVEGESLQDRVERSSLDFGETMRVIRPIAQALAYLHEQGVIHRDVKPDNIWLRRVDSTPLLLDTGAARSMEDSRKLSTGIFTMFGAPELRGRAESRVYGEVGPPADVFALAGVCAYALSGREPPDIGLRMQRAEDDPLKEWTVPGAPHVVAALRRGLNLNAQRRPQSPLALLNEIVSTDGGPGEHDPTLRLPTLGDPVFSPRYSGTATPPSNWLFPALGSAVGVALSALLVPDDPLLAALVFLVVHLALVALCSQRRRSQRRKLAPMDAMPLLNILELFRRP